MQVASISNLTDEKTPGSVVEIAEPGTALFKSESGVSQSNVIKPSWTNEAVVNTSNQANSPLDKEDFTYEQLVNDIQYDETNKTPYKSDRKIVPISGMKKENSTIFDEDSPTQHKSLKV